MWLTVATWIGAIATVGLFAGAVVTAIYAVRAFREQAKQVAKQAEQVELQRRQLEDQQKVNLLQAKELSESLEEREQDREQRRRDQANRVFTWPDVIQDQPRLYYAQVHNASSRPVYELTVTLHVLCGEQEVVLSFEPVATDAVMPGAEARIPRSGGKPWDFPYGAGLAWSEARFRDAAGVRWTVTSKGEITELP